MADIDNKMDDMGNNAANMGNNAANTGNNAPERELPEGYERTNLGAYVTIKIGVRPGFMLRQVGKAFMVMPTGPRMKEYEGVITLNETGAFLFRESQKEEPTKQKLMDACKAEYGATDEEAKQAVESFVMQCAQCGIFEKTSVFYDKTTGKIVEEENLDL